MSLNSLPGVSKRTNRMCVCFSDEKDWIGFYQQGVDLEIKFINTNHLSGNIDAIGTNSTIDNGPLLVATQVVAVASR